MAAYIKNGQSGGPENWRGWHVGEPIPDFGPGRIYVMTIQADGDELDLILTAMKNLHLRQHGSYVVDLTDGSIVTEVGHDSGA